MPTTRLDDIQSVAYELFGPPRQRRSVIICFGAESRLKYWDDQVACIEITRQCESEPVRGAFQLAHEIVHTLDPVELGRASVLEEGVATYFQHFYVADRVVRTTRERQFWRYPEPRDYKRAYDLIAPVFESDRFALRRLRESGVALSNASLANLLAFAPSLSARAATELLQRFEAWRETI